MLCLQLEWRKVIADHGYIVFIIFGLVSYCHIWVNGVTF